MLSETPAPRVACTTGAGCGRIRVAAHDAVVRFVPERFSPPPSFDEAGQCTIPSIVPLLFRAKRALVIGDPMQLAHICTVDRGTDAVLRARFGVPQPWLAEHRLSPVRHSAFAAAARIVGTPMLLDEHYRCHPAIAGVVNRLFYGDKLAVLTDVHSDNRVQVDGPPIVWRDVIGRAERGPNGTSWRNTHEADDVVHCVDELVAALPREATIGVVTPYRPQADELSRRLRDHGDRVRAGTAHSFQGGERDVMVFSLVADRYQGSSHRSWERVRAPGRHAGWG
jgi:superfamily I DNA and/or RNA helicase